MQLRIMAPAALSIGLALHGIAFAQAAASTAPADQAASAQKPAPASASPGPASAGVEKRIKELHSKMRITAAEQPQWDKFVGVMRANAHSMDEAFRGRSQNFQKLGAVDNMQSYAKIAQLHADHIQALVPAFQELYATMSDEQKRLADDVFRNFAAKTQARAQSGARG